MGRLDSMMIVGLLSLLLVLSLSGTITYALSSSHLSRILFSGRNAIKGRYHASTRWRSVQRRASGAKVSDEDKVESLDPFNQFLFNRFALAVGYEITAGQYIPNNYTSLISTINTLSFTGKSEEVTQRSKNMLVALFPTGLLPAYKLLFGNFPKFSAWMNCWVTHWTTQWLMGPSNVTDLVLSPSKSNC